MMYFLTTQPLWVTGFCLILLPTALSMAGPPLVRRYVPLDRIRTNNEVAGFKFATIGVIYAVLLAFAVIVVWEKFSGAEDDVAQEAGAAAVMYRLGDGIENDTGGDISAAVTFYLKTAIAEDWPAMARGRGSRTVTRALNDLYAVTLRYSPKDGRGQAVLENLLRQLDDVTAARRARLVLASGIVPGVIWMVLWIGAVLTTGFTFFFGAANLRAQTMMTGALAMLVFSGLFVIVVIDRPFAGPVHVEPTALDAVLDAFSGDSRR
jgi:hypothetical protein